ncbi:MAG: LPS export ABC transporter periplasmic protein LptC [Nitrospirae bacterium]|nr:LPS export ABC transporter periplasmic protein LptC [Nitrospirota bacterium]
MRITSKWKLLIGIIYIALFTVIVAGFLAGDKDVHKRQSVMQTLGDTAQKIEDFYLTRIANSKIEWEVGARNATIASGEEDAVLQNINITHMTPSGSTIVLTADNGRYNVGTNSFFIEKGENDVSIRIAQDIVINVGDLVWSDEDRQVRSSGMVRVTGQTFVLDGEELVADLDTGVYEIRKNIKARIW